MHRPATVPDDAVFFDHWQEWGAGATVDDRMEGPWRFWRTDGLLVEESGFRAGQPHGAKRRYHDDGSLAECYLYEHGLTRGGVEYRSANPTRERNLNWLPGVIHRWAIRCDDAGLGFSQRFWAVDGTELDVRGRALPARPPAVSLCGKASNSG